ncbi:MAG TPA: peptidoglycan DD-metalloendopeptidase family protein [Armatimonadota bacterium]
MRLPIPTPKYRIILCGVLLSCLLLPWAVRPAYAARNKKVLRAKRAAIQTKIVRVQGLLRQAKVKEQKKRQQLFGVEHRLRAARGQLRAATLRYQRAQMDLQHANSNLHAAKRVFSSTQGEVGSRLVATYERGNRGYLELLMTARDFGDMLERMQLAQFLQEQDTTALNDLKARRDQMVARQQQVKTKTREVALWRQQVSILRERTESEHYQVAEDLDQAREMRAGYEAEYAELMRTSAEITSMLQRMQHTAAGRRRFNQVYTGAVGGLPVHGRITSPFGCRYHPIFHTMRMHTGLDIAAPTGTPIGAGGGGEVIFAGRRGGYGNAVMIDHGHGRTTLYGHMSAILVHVGQVVVRGQTVGRVGATGFATGPHLHYEVRINGTPVNPL